MAADVEVAALGVHHIVDFFAIDLVCARPREIDKDIEGRAGDLIINSYGAGQADQIQIPGHFKSDFDSGAVP